MDRAVRHRPHGPGRSYMSARDRAMPHRLLGPGRSYIVLTGPGGAGSTAGPERSYMDRAAGRRRVNRPELL